MVEAGKKIKKIGEKKQKLAAIIELSMAMVLNAVVVLLTPLARDYGWKQFMTEPMYLLRYVLRPFAMALLGWAVVETCREFAGIRIWDGKSEKTRKTVRTVFYVLMGCLAIAAVLTLWLGAKMAYQWYFSEKIMNTQGSFDSSTVPHLMPERLSYWILYFYVFCLDRFGVFGGVCFFLGAASAFCRIEKGEAEKDKK